MDSKVVMPCKDKPRRVREHARRSNAWCVFFLMDPMKDQKKGIGMDYLGTALRKKTSEHGHFPARGFGFDGENVQNP